MKKTNLILTGIIFLAIFLRFWGLQNDPPSLYWDEVSQGYNSYSVLKTGYDEHHEFLPVVRFQAFGDYKAPVYIYLDVPFIAFFGKTNLAVRFPSALFGVLTVLFTYFLTRELFYKQKKRELPALLSAFFLAISPWHIQLSRVAYEGNIATFFTVLGMVLFFFGIRKKPYFLIFSLMSFVIGFYAFNAHRIFIPLLVAVLVLLYSKTILQQKKLFITACIIGVIMLLPFARYFMTPESKLRFNEVNIFSNISVVKSSNQHIAEDGNSISARVFDNRRILFGLLYLKHYFDFQNPTYLFFTGDGNPRFSLQDNGELFLWMLPLLVVGGYGLFGEKSKTSLFILLWFLLAPIGAATARETPHALRAETFIPIYEIIAAFGTLLLFEIIKKETVRKTILSVYCVIIVVCLVIFLHDYFMHFPVTYGGVFQYGYKQAVEKAAAIENQYDYIFFTNTYGRAYIYELFYGNFTPSDFWREGNVARDAYGFYNVSAIGKYVFDVHVNDKKYTGKKILYVVSPGELPASAKILDTVKFLDGNTAFVIAER